MASPAAPSPRARTARDFLSPASLSCSTIPPRRTSGYEPYRPRIHSYSTGADIVLRKLFEAQAELNQRIGFDAQALRQSFDPLQAGRWLNDYIAAASNELEELRDSTYWKHWCKEARQGHRFAIHDLQNARVEVIDLLFFWISMAQCVGLDADDVHELYMKKLKVNHQRQDTDYSMTEKDETDNKTVNLEP